MVIFSHIEHILHKYPLKVNFSHIELILNKYPLKVKFSHKCSYFHTLSIFYPIILLLSVAVLFFEILDFFMVVIAQVWSFIGRWYSWLDHRGDERRNLIKLIELFLIDDILNSDNSSFPGVTILSLLFVVSRI
jgi:hypothetical protein